MTTSLNGTDSQQMMNTTSVSMIISASSLIGVNSSDQNGESVVIDSTRAPPSQQVIDHLIHNRNTNRNDSNDLHSTFNGWTTINNTSNYGSMTSLVNNISDDNSPLFQATLYNNSYYNSSSFSSNSIVFFAEDVGDYFLNSNNGVNSTFGVQGVMDVFDLPFNCSNIWTNESCGNGTGGEMGSDYSYWALILVLFPIFTLFGNVLVILAVYRERTLQTVTNYFIVSLALADLLVAVVVMPFAVYVLVNGKWGLPSFVCDFYIAMDVTCSTSSIFNLVAISIDRYIAVTQPIKYAKHKNNRRVWMTIALVWVISAAIGSPIVLGLNNTPDRVPDLCLFYNSDFIIYSSLSSFYIPCIIMVFLYYNIFKALRNRARKAKAARKPNLSDIKPGSVIENIAQTRRLAETTLGPTLVAPPSGMEEERPTNTGSGSQEEEEEVEKEGERSPGSDDCHIIPNDKSTEFILATVVEESAVVATLASAPIAVPDPNGNNDSGYAASNVEEVVLQASSNPNSPRRRSVLQPEDKQKSQVRRNGAAAVNDQPLSPMQKGSPSIRPSKEMEPPEEETPSTGLTGSKKERKSTTSSRFTIYKVNKASRKKREKSSAKKERKATKTLAIVLGVFLICWVPFFTCNILDAMCTKLSLDCSPGVTAFILTTWLGYMNSFVNPVIYTIFNPEFRKAFKKLMSLGT